MNLRLLLPLLVLSIASSLSASEHFGFKVINVLNLKDNSKCSGVVLNTEFGCHAVTSAHCVRGLGIGEENIIISEAIKPEIKSSLGQEIYQKLVHSMPSAKRSALIKAKPSSDLAQIRFDQAWAPTFCNDSYKLNEENTQRNLHINEVYSAREQTEPGPVNQHLPGSMGQTRSPNPTIYYRPSQNYLLMALGFQNDLATLLSISPVSFDSFHFLEDKMKSRLNVEYSSLPGFEFGYQVKGINLSQGMSGGALIEVEKEKIEFKGLSASFYPFQWKSNFIPASYIIEFLKSYQDDLSDQFEISINNQSQVASDQQSAKEDERLQRMKEDGEIPDYITMPKKPRHTYRQRSGPVRVPRNQVRFGDTDQDDVNGDDSLVCSAVPSAIDPIFDQLPPVTNCFDLSQTRFQYSGVMAKELNDQIIIAYGDEQINGLSDLRSIKARQGYNEKNLITRPLGGYPTLEMRKNILNNLSGVYFEKENSAVTNQAMHRYAHLGEGFTRQYLISPSSNALIRESLINDTELYGDLFTSLYHYDISNDINTAHNVKLKLKVSESELKLGIKLTDNNQYSFAMIPVFDSEYKKLTFKTTLTKYDEKFVKIDSEEFELACDNRNFLKLICSHEKMELGLSSNMKGGAPSIRVAFWEGFITKKEALEQQSLKMFYTFDQLEGRSSITRRVDVGTEFNKLKLKKLLPKLELVDIKKEDVLSFMTVIPNKVKAQLTGELEVRSFVKGDELFHVVFDKKMKSGVLFDRSFKVVGVILKGKISTSAYDIF